MSNQNTSGEKNFFRLYWDAEATIDNASNTLTAALCAMNSIENALIDESLGEETIGAFYGIRSIIQNCRDDLASFGEGKEPDSMPANCE